MSTESKYSVGKELCIICGNSGGLYIVHQEKKIGPFCSDHRFQLQSHIHNKSQEMISDHLDAWVSEFLLLKEDEEP